jgi:hypothetical protein
MVSFFCRLPFYRQRKLDRPAFTFLCSHFHMRLSYRCIIQDLRGEQLRDLIFNGDAMRDRKKRKAKVTLVYIVDVNEHPELDAGSELRFTRQLSAAGNSSYRLRGREVTWAAYNQQVRFQAVVCMQYMLVPPQFVF